MNPENINNDSGKLFYSTDGKDWKPIGEVKNLHLTEPVEISYKIELTEEDAAKLYAQLDPLEIVEDNGND